MPTWTKEQTEAIEKSGSNIIVSAGAGSGKTAVLSERVIYKLHHGIHVDELLILTFTRAAAEEMKDRIRKKIKKDSELKDELDRLESAYITTFDSFALSVVKKYHYLLNLPSDISITDDSIVSLEKSKILEEVFDRFYDIGDEEFTAMIERFSIKNDNMIKTMIQDLANKVEGYIDRDGFLNRLVVDFYSEQNIDDIVREYLRYIEEKKHILSLELANAYSYFDEDYNSKLDASLLPIINAKTIDELANLKSTKLPSLKRGTDDEAKAVKENIKTALEELMELTVYGSIENIKSDIESTRCTTISIVKVLKAFFERLDEYKKAKNIYTFADIASLAMKILKEFESARFELQNKFKEIMIDEYQDTNDIQENFIALIARDNVYMVGDIKQSIYRFRGSNPNIFKEKYDSYSEGRGGKKIDLIKNFRSRSEVLNNINRIFDLLMDDDLGGAAYTVSHEMLYGNTAYDEEKCEGFNYDFKVLEYDNPKDSDYTDIEVEIFSIARDIEKKKRENFEVFDKDTGKMRPFKFSDAVIILDRSTYFDDFKKIFEYLSIPLSILRDDKLTSSDDIYIIKNLIDFLIHIKAHDFTGKFRYDFMSIARSFLYEYTDEYIFDILTEKNYKDTTLYKDIDSIEDYDSKTIRELIMDLLDKTDFYNKLYKVGDFTATEIRIENILNLANNLASLGFGIEQFKDYLDNIIESGLEIKYTPPFVDMDSVKILTIHKSKGLEYPLCYFADLDHAFNTREIKSKLLIDLHYGLISGIENENDKDSDSILKILYKNNFYREEIGEKIRLFYVALTRAREHMVIVLPKKDTHKLEKNEYGTIEFTRRIKFRKMSDFIYSVKDYMPSYFSPIDIEALNLTKEYLYTKTSTIDNKNADVVDFTVDELTITPEKIENKIFSKKSFELLSKETKDNMAFGTKIHEILEYIDFKNFDPMSIKDDFLRKKVTKLLDHPLLENIKGATIYKEYEFIYEKDDVEYHGSIDLMLEYADHIDIVDYKLKNLVDSHYREQLMGYKDYISTISNKRVSLYLYSIMDGTISKID